MTAVRQAIAARMGQREFIVLISMLMALTALAIDMMLPAFGDMRVEFGLDADSNAVAPVVTVFLVGYGLGQLLWGPLSDALGRKRILYIGLAVYVVGAMGAVFVPSLSFLLAWRFLGGLGAAAVRVVANGTVRDRYRGDEMAKVLSYIMAVFILVPAIAPSMGAAVLTVGSWRWVLVFFAAFALALAAWSLRLPETLPSLQRIPLRGSRLLAATRAVVTSRFAMGLIIAQMAAFGFFASYLASSELIIRDVFGLGTWFPLIFAGGALVLGTGMLLNPRFIDRFGLRRMLRFVLSGYPVASTVFLAIALATGGHPPFWLYLAGLLPILLVHSFVMPDLNSAAMMPMGNIAGTAAAVIGTISTLGGAMLGASIDAAFDGTIIPFASAGLVLSIVAYLSYRWADAVWTESADRELAPRDQMDQISGTLSGDML